MGPQACAQNEVRCVFDTNTVVSALLFTSGRVAWLRNAWSGKAQPLVCSETVQELMRVLHYPKFKLSVEEINELLDTYLRPAIIVRMPKKWPRVPPCRDPFDQVFLALAMSAKADVLVTGDKDLLAVQHFRIRILSPEMLRQELNKTESK